MDDATIRRERAKLNRERAQHWYTAAQREYAEACQRGERGEAERMHRAYARLELAVEFLTLACDVLTDEQA